MANLTIETAKIFLSNHAKKTVYLEKRAYITDEFKAFFTANLGVLNQYLFDEKSRYTKEREKRTTIKHLARYASEEGGLPYIKVAKWLLTHGLAEVQTFPHIDGRVNFLKKQIKN